MNIKCCTVELTVQIYCTQTESKLMFHCQIISKLFTLKLQLETFEWAVCTNEIVKVLFAKSVKDLYFD